MLVFDIRRPVVPLVLLLTAACTDNAPGPTGPVAPDAPAPAIPAEAIPLTINPATGEVRVGRQAPEPPADGLAYSMLGDDVVRLEAQPCTLSPVPGNSKLIRCTFDIRITNLLSRTELVTPTSFPRPPAGVEGVLVFPFLSGAIGAPGGTAVPSPDWDEDPINFFNDFAGCTKSANDCYRWELFEAPLAPGIPSVWRTVGFDIPKSAQAVGVYLVVAADLLDDPEYTVVLTHVAALSGELATPTMTFRQGSTMRVGLTTLFSLPGAEAYDELRSVTGFDLSGLPPTAEIRSASLDLWVPGMLNAPLGGTVRVETIDIGQTLELADFGSETLALAGSGTPTSTGSWSFTLPDAVQAAIDDGRSTLGFRLRWVHDGTPEEEWLGIHRSGETYPPPTLRITYGYD